jgi:FkbM family methyltransferase
MRDLPAACWDRARSIKRIWQSFVFERQVLAKFAFPGSLSFDIGANVGQVSAMLLRLGSRVIAIEPQKENIEKLEQRFRNQPKLTIVTAGVGEKEGKAELLVCNASDCSSISSDFTEILSKSGRVPPEYKWEGTQTITLTTLDKLRLQFGEPDFVKIDVEGYEYEVLKGLSSAVRALSFEFTPERLGPALSCISWLCQLGEYEFNFTIGRRPRFALPSWVTGQSISTLISDKKYHVGTGPGGDVYARLRASAN